MVTVMTSSLRRQDGERLPPFALAVDAYILAEHGTPWIRASQYPRPAAVRAPNRIIEEAHL